MKKIFTIEKILQKENVLITGSRPNSLLNPYIKYYRNSIGVLDIKRVWILFDRAVKFLIKIASLKKKGNILFIGYPKNCSRYLLGYAQQKFFRVVCPKELKKKGLRKELSLSGNYNSNIDLIVIYDLKQSGDILSELIQLGVPIIYFTSGNTEIIKALDHLRGGFFYPVYINNYSTYFCYIVYKQILEYIVNKFYIK